MYRVLVVEDEEWIRRGIIKSILWKSLGLELAGEAENGAQALEILDHVHADIVLTDMKMPLCDGKTLLQEIERKKLKCEIIVLSEYTDFEYTHQAIHSHAIDYILKPVDPAQLNHLLRMACEKLEQQNITADGRDPYTMVFETAVSHTSQEQFKVLCSRYEESFRNSNIIVSAVQCQTRHSENSGIRSAIDETISYIPYPTRILPYHHSETFFCIFSVIPKEYSAGKRQTYTAWLQKLFNTLKERESGDCRIGTARENSNIASIKDALNEAFAALQFLHYGHGDIIHYDRVKNLKINAELPAVNEQQINDLLIHCNMEEITHLKQSVVNVLKTQKYLYIPAIRRLLIDLTLTLERCSGKAGYTVNISSEIGENYIDWISRINWLEDVNVFLDNVLTHTIETIAKKRPLTASDIVDEVIKLIEQHYMNEINLMQIAQQYHINYVHLSRRFKEKTGKTFTDFLLKVRMEKAKELIEKSGYTEKEAARLVGYSNPYYFSSSYKKYYQQESGGNLK